MLVSTRNTDVARTPTARLLFGFTVERLIDE
jgi:hypothetical protein